MISPMVMEKDYKNKDMGSNPKKVKVKNIQLTLNEPEKWNDLRLYLTGLKNLQYIIACKEKAPSTGHIHIHCYCQYRKCTSVTISKLQGAHLELCKGSSQQNIAYIKGEDKKEPGEIIFEDGTPLTKGGNKIGDVKAMTKEERDQLPLQYYKIVKAINEEEDNLIDLDDVFKEDMRVYWIWGPSGEGKTKMAYEMFKDAGYKKICQVKHVDNFWLGTNTHTEACLYDDFRDSHMRPSELINFIDYNIHPMNIKGGAIQNRYKFIIITSVQRPEEIYATRPEEEKKQWLRRITEIIDIRDY